MDYLDVTITSPRQDIYAGIAISVSSINSAGKFDVLPEHANFVTLIDKKPIIVRTMDKRVLTFNFPLAIISVINNKVRIYTNIQPAIPK
ncbi:MAG: hypothetical protein V1808_00230 [Candidatus Daviesbacteria bacterium]